MTFLAILDPKLPQGLDFGSEHNQDRWRMYVDDNRGKRVKVMIPKKVRSLSQNNLFWKYLEIIERETGNDTDTMHKYVTAHLTPKVEKSVRIMRDGEWISHVGIAGKGTSELTSQEFGEMMDRLSALVNVPIPSKEDMEALGYISNY